MNERTEWMGNWLMAEVKLLLEEYVIGLPNGRGNGNFIPPVSLFSSFSASLSFLIPLLKLSFLVFIEIFKFNPRFSSVFVPSFLFNFFQWRNFNGIRFFKLVKFLNSYNHNRGNKFFCKLIILESPRSIRFLLSIRLHRIDVNRIIVSIQKV